MKKLTIPITVMLLFVACKQNAPKDIIGKEKMLNVMLDMQLTDAYLNQVYNNDTMKMQAHSRYNYIFDKYKIDSAKFTNSLIYYSKNAKQLDEMYTQISDSLTNMQEKLKKEQEAARKRAYNLYDYVFAKFKTDSAKFSNAFKYYTLDAKALYRKYQVSDSLRHLQDSLSPKPKPVEEIRKFKKAGQ